MRRTLLIATLIVLVVIAGRLLPWRGGGAAKGPVPAAAPGAPVESVREPPVGPRAGTATAEGATNGAGATREEAQAPPTPSAPAASAGVAVRVVDPAGNPVAGARVRFEYGWVKEGRVQAVAAVQRTSDASGIAVLLDEPPGDQAWGVLCRADDGASRASAPLELLPPIPPGPHDLVLLPGGSVRVVLTADAEGPPLEGAYVHLSPSGVESKAAVRMATTNERGEASFGPLAPGAWDVYAAYSAAAEQPARAVAEVRAGEETLLELTLAEPGERFAVSGVFVDEEGRPLPGAGSLWIGESRARGRLVHADGQGRFLLLREPCDSLLVELAQRADMDDFEPVSIVVPFGTRDLVFRRIARRERRVARFRVVDYTTGEPLEQASVCLHLGDAMQCLEWNMGRRRGDVIEIRYGVRPGLLWTAWAPGRVRVTGLVDGSEDVREVRLAPGIAGTLVVRDAVRGDPIGGASVFDEAGALLGRTRSDGAIHLEGEAASGPLEISAPGHRPRTWYLSWPGEVVWLEPR